MAGYDCPNKHKVSDVAETVNVEAQTGRLQAGCHRAVVQQQKMSDH